MRKQTIMVLAVLASLAGCSSDSENPSEPMMQPDLGDTNPDPVDDVCTPHSQPSGETVIVYSLRPEASRLPTGDSVLYDYGSKFFAVDNTCHVWAFNAGRDHGKWSNQLIGTVSPNQVQSLLLELDVENWTGIGVEEHGTSHPAQTVIQVGDKTYFGLCSACTEPELRPALVARNWLTEIQAELSGFENTPEALWYTAELALEDYHDHVPVLHSLPEGFEPITYTHLELLEKGFGTGQFLSDPETIQAVWDIRKSYLEMTESEWWYAYIPFLLPSGDKILLKFRRAIPEIEGGNGLLAAEVAFEERQSQ